MSTFARAALSASLAAAIACAGPETTSPGADLVAPDASESNDQEELAKKEGLELKKYDLNRDKNPDVFKFFKTIDDPDRPGQTVERLLRKEMDINHDGRIDIIQLWDATGSKSEERTDLDFDGRLDERLVFDQGQILRKEIDLNYDGSADVTKFYVEGQLQRIESDRSGNGQTDTWEYFESGELDRIGTDTDGDGEVDQWDKKRTEQAEGEPGEGAAESQPESTTSDAEPDPAPPKESEGGSGA